MKPIKLFSRSVLALILAYMILSGETQYLRPASASDKSAASPTWVRTYHLSGAAFAQEITSILPNQDGSFVLVGYDWTDQFMDSSYLPLAVKIDSAGNASWYKYQYGNPYTHDLAGVFTQVIPANDGGYIFSAISSKANPSQVSGYRYDRVMKVDEAGTIIWNKIYQENEDIQGIAPTADSTGYVAAFTNQSSGGIMRIDNTGSVVWRYLLPSTSQILAIIPDSDHSFVSAGLAANWNTSGDIWFGRIGDGGTVEWQETIHAQPNGGRFNGLVRTSDGNFLAAGKVNTASGSSGWLLKFDPTGAVLWQKSYDFPGGEFIALSPGNDGGVLASGYAALVRVNGAGDLLWSKGITGSRYVHGVSALNDGGFIVTGFFPGGDGNLTVVRMDGDGNTSCSVFVSETIAVNTTLATVTPVNSSPQSSPITASSGTATMTGFTVEESLCGLTEYKLCLPLVAR